MPNALVVHTLHFALAIALFAGAPPSAAGAAGRGRAGCDGDTITTIDVRAYPPGYSGLAGEARERATQWLGVHHTPTRASVITAYLRFGVGEICTERNRAESERVLRAQPFIASAVVRAVPAGPRHTRVEVEVVDEVRLQGGLHVARGTISDISAGTIDLDGRGLTLIGGAERGFAYRDGFGIEARQYGMFGRPDFLAVEAERHAVIGEHLLVELAEPFATDLQRRAFHGGSVLESGYSNLVRPAGEDVAIFARRVAYDVGLVRRLGNPSGRGTIGLLGAALIGEDVRTGTDLVVVTDTGLLTEAVNPYATRYPAYAISHAVAIGGIRALRFVTVRGFDGLTAAQDVGSGVQANLLAGPSLWASGREGDLFMAADVYAGVGDEGSFLAIRSLAEARRTRTSGDWSGVVAGGRLSWYDKLSPTLLQQVSVDGASIRDVGVPLQLTFRETDGGLPGFRGSTFAGGTRLTARVEERKLVGTFGTRADAAVSLFAAAGKLWAGDVPFGATTPVSASAGFAISSAVPAGGKRTYRLEVAVPLNPAPGGSRIEVSFGSSDRTRLLWLEPNDLSRARTGAVPVSLMKW